MADKKLPSVQEHAQSIMDKVIAERGPVEDLEAARQAASVPTFSAGTAAIHPTTGKPILPKDQQQVPEFAEGQVAVPEADGSEKVEPEAAPSSKEAILAAHQERLKATEAVQAEAAAAPEPEPAPQVAGAAAAETAAEAIADDLWAEMDEFTFADPDIETEIPIRVPKKYAETVKRGYGRRAALDREIRYAKEAEPVLRQLISDGTIHNVLELIQFARDNPEYGQLVTGAFNRAKQGLPLIEQAKIEAAASAIAPPPAAVPDALPSEDDPFGFSAMVNPLRKEIETLQQRIAREDAERQATVARAAQQQQQNAQRDAEVRAAHADLARAYPGHARLDLGPSDPFFQKAVAQARTAGYGEAYGLRAGIVFGAQMAMQIEQERLSATSSPTADALRTAENQHGELARREAAAASRKVGAGAAMHAAPPPLPARPTSFRPDGSLKTPAEMLRDNQMYIEAVSAQPA